MTTSNNHTEYRLDIQGLRGIAVLLVVLYHAGVTSVPGGYIGVDVFFVVSGYVITGLLHREVELTDRINLVQFYGRRIRRLLPAAAIVLTVTFAGFWWLYSPVERQRLASSALATALYVSNIWFAMYATDYLGGDGATNPLLHTWSLAVEEQFYLFWPLLIWVLASRIGKPNRRIAILTAVIIVSVVSFISAVTMTHVSQPWAFFSSPTRAWEFGVGALTYLIHGANLRFSNLTRAVLAGAGLLLIFCSAAVLGPDTLMPGFAAIAPVSGTALTIFAGVPGDHGVHQWLGMKPLVWIGDLSYGWYLWHWPVLVALKESHSTHLKPLLLGGVLFSLLLAWVMYRFLENPIRRQPYLAMRPAMSITGGVMITILCAGVAYVGLEHAKAAGLAAEQAVFKRAQDDIPKILSKTGCHASISQVSIPRNCTFANPSASATLVLFGDSHAEQWFPALEQLATIHHWRLISITKSGCPAVSVEPYLENFRRPYFECSAWRKEAMQRIASIKPALVVVGNSYQYGKLANGAQQAGPAWVAGLDQTLRGLEAANTHVLLIRDIPHPVFNAPICLSRAVSQGRLDENPCTFDPTTPTNDQIFESERAVVAIHPRTSIADLSQLICPSTPCSVQQHGVILYSDSNHMTTHFSASLAGNLGHYISPVMEIATRMGG